MGRTQYEMRYAITSKPNNPLPRLELNKTWSGWDSLDEARSVGYDKAKEFGRTTYIQLISNAKLVGAVEPFYYKGDIQIVWRTLTATYLLKPNGSLGAKILKRGV